MAAHLSKPNIFILNNRWDASVTEPETVSEVINYLNTLYFLFTWSHFLPQCLMLYRVGQKSAVSEQIILKFVLIMLVL